MVGNPLEMLYHAIGQLDINNIKDYQQPLKGNEIYTKLSKDNQNLQDSETHILHRPMYCWQEINIV